MTDLPAIQRPNGKLYRPRRLRVVGWNIDPYPGHDTEWQVAVLGTHDIDQARALAPQGYFCPYLINPERGWVRDGMCHGERTWLHDDVNGQPCVIFDESDDPPEIAAAVRGDQP